MKNHEQIVDNLLARDKPGPLSLEDYKAAMPSEDNDSYENIHNFWSLAERLPDDQLNALMMEIVNYEKFEAGDGGWFEILFDYYPAFDASFFPRCYAAAERLVGDIGQ